MTTKICKKCGKNQPLSNYLSYVGYKDTIYTKHICNDCVKLAVKEYRSKNKRDKEDNSNFCIVCGIRFGGEICNTQPSKQDKRYCEKCYKLKFR